MKRIKELFHYSVDSNGDADVGIGWFIVAAILLGLIYL